MVISLSKRQRALAFVAAVMPPAMCAAVLLLLAAAPGGAVPTGDPPAPYGCWLEEQLSSLYARVSPSVVSVVSYRVRTTRPGTETEGGRVTSYRRLVASGVVVGQHGCVVTTARIAQPGDSLTIHFPDGRHLGARYKGMDPVTNIAVLNLTSEGPFPYLEPPAETKSALPQWVAAVAYGPWQGNNPGRASLTLSEKSAIETIQTRYSDSPGVVWRIRAPFYPGNGGGALVSLSGEWIGLITGAVAGDEGGAAASAFQGDGSRGADAPRAAGVIVPAEVILQAIMNIESGDRVMAGFLGVRTNARSDPSGGGIDITEVLADSPAARGGLRPGDIIIAYDGHPVTSEGELMALVQASAPGQRVKVRLDREGSTRTVTFCVGDSDAAGLYLKGKRSQTAERLSLQRELHRTEQKARLLRERLVRIQSQSSNQQP